MAAAAAPRRHEKRGPRGRRQRGDARLQGYSKTWGGDICYIDKSTMARAVQIYDVRCELESWCCVPLGYTPRTTSFFRSRYNDAELEDDLNSALLRDNLEASTLLS
jgi:hypothetical protein